MANFFVVYNQGNTSGGGGERAGSKNDRDTTPKLLEGPIKADVVKVEAATAEEARRFVRSMFGSLSTIVSVTTANWAEGN